MGLKFQRKGLCVLHSRVVETLLTKLLTIQFEFWMHRISYASKCSIALYLPAGRMISLSCQHSMSARLSQLCAWVASCVALRQSQRRAAARARASSALRWPAEPPNSSGQRRAAWTIQQDLRRRAAAPPPTAELRPYTTAETSWLLFVLTGSRLHDAQRLGMRSFTLTFGLHDIAGPVRYDSMHCRAFLSGSSRGRARA